MSEVASGGKLEPKSAPLVLQVWEDLKWIKGRNVSSFQHDQLVRLPAGSFILLKSHIWLSQFEFYWKILNQGRSFMTGKLQFQFSKALKHNVCARRERDGFLRRGHFCGFGCLKRDTRCREGGDSNTRLTRQPELCRLAALCLNLRLCWGRIGIQTSTSSSGSRRKGESWNDNEIHSVTASAARVRRLSHELLKLRSDPPKKKYSWQALAFP